MTPIVTVIDYGIGNLFSVRRALEHAGATVRFSSDPADVLAAERVVLPGVGAFADGMRGLEERGLVAPLREFAASGRPLLGICLGMQLLASVSEEFGEHAGLNVIPGRVLPVPPTTTEGDTHKIPHIGWTELAPAEQAVWRGTPLETTAPGTSVYLVHSYHFMPDDPAHLLADCRYGGHRITAAVGSGRIFGCQFHPEKSGPAGLEIVHRFVSC